MKKLTLLILCILLFLALDGCCVKREDNVPKKAVEKEEIEIPKNDTRSAMRVNEQLLQLRKHDLIQLNDGSYLHVVKVYLEDNTDAHSDVSFLQAKDTEKELSVRTYYLSGDMGVKDTFLPLHTRRVVRKGSQYYREALISFISKDETYVADMLRNFKASDPKLEILLSYIRRTDSDTAMAVMYEFLLKK